MSTNWRTYSPVVAAAIGLLTLAASSPASAADGPAAVNIAVAQNSRAGHAMNHQAWRVVSMHGPVLFATNSALVAATGAGSATTAVAFEIVTASGTAKIVANNRASTNEVSCSACDAAAVAEQWILAAPAGLIRLTPAGQAALQQIDRQLTQIVRSGDTPTQKYNEVIALESDVTAILSSAQNVVVSAASANALRGAHALGVARRETPRVSATGSAGVIVTEPGYTLYRYGQASLSTGSGSVSITA